MCARVCRFYKSAARVQEYALVLSSPGVSDPVCFWAHLRDRAAGFSGMEIMTRQCAGTIAEECPGTGLAKGRGGADMARFLEKVISDLSLEG